MSKIIGIDLGTTFSAIAQLDDLGNPEVLASTDSNKKITASAVYVKDKNVELWICGKGKCKEIQNYVDQDLRIKFLGFV